MLPTMPDKAKNEIREGSIDLCPSIYKEKTHLLFAGRPANNSGFRYSPDDASVYLQRTRPGPISLIATRRVRPPNGGCNEANSWETGERERERILFATELQAYQKGYKPI